VGKLYNFQMMINGTILTDHVLETRIRQPVTDTTSFLSNPTVAEFKCPPQQIDGRVPITSHWHEKLTERVQDLNRKSGQSTSYGIRFPGFRRLATKITSHSVFQM
jgi:hypothetical protein